MHPFRLTVAAALLAVVTHPLMASPVEAKQISSDWQNAITEWSKATRLATTPEEQAQLINSRPDAEKYAIQMWQCIGTSLEQEWTLEPASWLLLMSQSLPRQSDASPLGPLSEQASQIKTAVLAHHIKSPKLTPVCMALAKLSDPASLSILEKIETLNPDRRIQGVAALGAAIALKGLGDDAALMRKRLNHLRKAIIDSADVTIGQTTVAELAENELYQIRYLSKGRVAPDLSSTDAAGRPIQLSDFQGKVVVLVFWSSTIPNFEHTIEFTKQMVKKFHQKPVEIIGVNHDPLQKLRAMAADETITWRNFSDPKNHLARQYRISNWPMVYVLDQKRKIQYSGTLGTFTELTAEALASENH